MDNQK